MKLMTDLSLSSILQAIYTQWRSDGLLENWSMSHKAQCKSPDRHTSALDIFQLSSIDGKSITCWSKCIAALYIESVELEFMLQHFKRINRFFLPFFTLDFSYFSCISGLLPSSLSLPKTSAPCRTCIHLPSWRIWITAFRTGCTKPMAKFQKLCQAHLLPPHPPVMLARHLLAARYFTTWVQP